MQRAQNIIDLQASWPKGLVENQCSQFVQDVVKYLS